MAESVTVYGDNRNSEISMRHQMRDKMGEKVHVIRSIQVAADASPSDTTVFTVPANKTFYLVRVTGSKSSAGIYGLRVYDAAGDSVTPNEDALFRAPITPEASDVAAYDVVFQSPIPVKQGLTLEGTNIPASATTYLQFEGYLI